MRDNTSRYADSVLTLGEIIVVVAWVLAVASVLAAVVFFFSTTESGASAVILALAVASGGLVNAALLALFGLYAQMRASEILERR